MSATLIDQALLRAESRVGTLPTGVTQQAAALWLHMTTGSSGCVAPCNMPSLRVPSMGALADGCVALAQWQASRGIRTIKGRPAKERGPVTVRTPTWLQVDA